CAHPGRRARERGGKAGVKAGGVRIGGEVDVARVECGEEREVALPEEEVPPRLVPGDVGLVDADEARHEHGRAEEPGSGVLHRLSILPMAVTPANAMKIVTWLVNLGHDPFTWPAMSCGVMA